MTCPPPHIKEICAVIDTHQSFAVVSHENPDGDSLGSQLALAIALKSMDKDARIVSKDPIPYFYDFLPHRELFMISGSLQMKPGEVMMALDCTDLERTGLSLFPAPPPLVVNIDHHISNTGFGDVNWIDPSASAASEMVFSLIKESLVTITPAIATSLYTGILTDTGSFQYSNTTTSALLCASQLVQAGANPQSIALAVYDRKNISALRLAGAVLTDMEIYHGNTMAILTVTREMLKRVNATYEDTEELVTLPRQIGEIKVSVLLKETAEGEFKVSLRSKNNVDVAQLAKRLGGGGHPNASGARMKGSLNKIKKKIIDLCAESLTPSN